MRTLLVMMVLLCVGAGSADAQRRRDPDGLDWLPGPVEFGVRGGHSFEERVGSAGSQLRIPLLRELLVVPSADVFFGDEAGVEWQLNADAVVRPFGLGGLYAGAGGAFVIRDSDGDDDEEWEAGYNLFAGLEGGSMFDASVLPFVEARWSYVDDFSPFRIAAGINVAVR